MVLRQIDEGKIIRSADKNIVKINSFGNTYVKHKGRVYDLVNELYDSKGNFKGIDVIRETPDEIETIYNRETGKTIVILKDSKGRKFKGVAKCSKEDTYNSIRGYSIAYARATIKKEMDRIKRLSK